MPKVTMLKTAQGSIDHLKVTTFKEGETYDIPDFLVKAFVDEMKVAEFAGRRAVVEEKMVSPAVENKSESPVVESKAVEEQPVAAKKVSARRQ